MVHVFAYGSLLNPTSLTRTLPTVTAQDPIPAHLVGFFRAFTVAFPNGGEQTDKAYYDDHGRRPPFVLFANAVPRVPHAERSGAVHGDDLVGAPLNGVLVQVNGTELSRLAERERRYRIIDVSRQITLTVDAGQPPADCVTFVGQPRFTRPQDVDAGVVARGYLHTIADGVNYWNGRHPGFALAYQQSTQEPAPNRIADLRRVDHPMTSEGAGRTSPYAPAAAD